MESKYWEANRWVCTRRLGILLIEPDPFGAAMIRGWVGYWWSQKSIRSSHNFQMFSWYNSFETQDVLLKIRTCVYSIKFGAFCNIDIDNTSFVDVQVLTLNSQIYFMISMILLKFDKCWHIGFQRYLLSLDNIYITHPYPCIPPRPHNFYLWFQIFLQHSSLK